METDACDVNQLDSDVLLPPRKRLLAGLKKQNSNGNGSPSPPPTGGASPSSISNVSSGSANVQTHLDNILAPHLNDPNLTPEEIAESSRSAAAVAAKAAKAARAAAEEKALKAAKAITAAKSALELFYSFPEEVISGKERSPRKNEQKKHVPVELLYSNIKGPGAADADLACRLHRVINSSPRVSKTSSSSAGKGHKNKKHKAMITSENPRVEVGSSIVSGSMFREHDIAGIVDSDSSNDNEAEKTRANEKTLCDKGRGSGPDKMEADPSAPKDKTGDESYSSGKRRGRVKLKKLPLSICNTKDQENHKEEGISKSSQTTIPEKNISKHRNNGKSLAQAESSPEGMIPMVSGPSWKCQDLKAPECAKQNKAVRS